MKKLYPFFPVFFLWILLPLSCQRERSSDDGAKNDSVLTALGDLIFSEPATAERKLSEYQKTLTDSMAWYRVQLYRGSAYNLSGDTLVGNRLYEEVEAWCRAHEWSKSLEGELWNHRGVDKMMQGQVKEGRECFERAYFLLNRQPKTKQLIVPSINLADACMQMGQMPESAGYYRYALFLSDSLRDDRYRTAIYMGLGQVYIDLENFDEAHRFFDLAGERIANESERNRFLYYFGLGNCYYLELRYDESLQNFKKAYALAESLGIPIYQLICSANIGEIYLMQDSLPQAREHLVKSAEIMGERQDVDAASRFYIQSLLTDLSLAEGKRKEALPFLLQNVDSLMVSSPRYLMLHYRRLQRYAVRDGLWKQAYDYQCQAARYADSLSNRQSRNTVAELAQRYERDTTLLRQRLVLADYETRNVRQQNYILIAVATAVVLALLGLLALLYSRRRTGRRLRLQMEKITELRMDVVRNRVSPHYIFNVLGTILPRMQKYPGLVGSVEMLIDVLRGNLLASDKVAVPLRDEIALVRRFVGLHHFCKGERPRVEWEIEEGLEESQILVPSMSLQIPVENALKHAFPELTDESVIRVVVKRTEGMLALYVHDNGQGYDPGRVCHTERDTGTGLLLLTRTLEILNRYNRANASLTIRNVEAPGQGTCVKFLIPDDYRFETSKSKS